MQRTIKKFVLLIALVCTVICCVAFAACVGGGKGDEKVTYSVTVTCDDSDLNLTAVTAQWKSGETVKESAKLDAEGKASVKLEKGNYTVTLAGELDEYTFTAASVTETKTDATITLTKKTAEEETATYTLTVTCDDDLDLTTVTAQWLSGKTVIHSVALTADGKASAELEKGNYTVALVGLSYFDYSCEIASVTAENTAAEIAITRITGNMPVAVTLPEGVELTADVKVKVTVDGKQFGELVDYSAEGIVVVVPRTGEYAVELVNLPNYLRQETTYEAIGITIAVEIRQVNYEITVTSEDPNFDYSNIKVVIGEEEYELNSAHKAIIPLFVGAYTVTLKGVDSEYYSYAPAELTVEIHAVTIIVKSKVLDLTVGTPAQINFADEDDERIVNLLGVQTDHYYAISVTSADELYTEHNFYITYAGETYTLGRDRIEAGEDSSLMIILTDSVLKIKADGPFDGAILEIQEVEEPIDWNVTLGEEKEVAQNGAGSYIFTAPQYGNYRIEIIGDVQIDDFSINLGEGAAIGHESNNQTMYAEFYAEADVPFAIDLFWYKTADAALTMLITHLPDGDFTLGEEQEVELNSSTYILQEYEFIAPVKGIYKLELLSHTSSQVYVRDQGANEPIIEFGEEAYGTFEAGKDEVKKLGFYQVDGSASCTAIITLVEVLPEVVKVDGDPVDTKFGDVIVEGLKAGRDYTVIVLLPKRLGTAGSTTKLTYNGQVYSMSFTDQVGDSNMYATFTAVKDVNIITISIDALSASGNEKFTISIIELPATEGPTGPAVGDNISVTPGDGKAAAVELNFGAAFVAGGSYTIQLTTVGAAWNYTYWLVYGDGQEVQFTYSGSDLLASFVATEQPVKFYCSEHLGMMGPGELVEVTLTITAAPEAAGSAAHKCADECEECGLCTSECNDPACQEKCAGHGSAIPDDAYWSKVVELDGTSIAFETVYLEAGEYTISISGDVDAVWVNQNNGTDLFNDSNVCTEENRSFTFTVKTAGSYDLRIINGLFDNSHKVITVVIVKA